MNKCDCYVCRKEIKGWENSETPIYKLVARCLETREVEICFCGGDKKLCDFYPEKRNKYVYTVE